MNLLEIKNLRMYFVNDKKTTRAVDGIDLILKEGQIACLVGESGCGKTMTGLSIAKLLPSQKAKIVSGEILFHGEDLLQLDDAKLQAIRGAKISYIFQDPSSALNPVLTIADQIAESLIVHKKLSKKEAVVEVVKLLGLCGIENPGRRIHSYPNEFSGGMKQRVMIAMAIASGPELIIADEPTTALDVTIQKEILELLNKLKSSLKLSILFITHDLRLVKCFGDTMFVMYGGKIVESGSVKDVINGPLHPYTRGLLNCIPKHGVTKTPLCFIDGMVPEFTGDVKMCRFSDRCSEKENLCRVKEPDLLNFGSEEEHFVRCVKYAFGS